MAKYTSDLAGVAAFARDNFNSYHTFLKNNQDAPKEDYGMRCGCAGQATAFKKILKLITGRDITKEEKEINQVIDLMTGMAEADINPETPLPELTLEEKAALDARHDDITRKIRRGFERDPASPYNQDEH